MNISDKGKLHSGEDTGMILENEAKESKKVVIEVNGRKVEMAADPSTGLEIKDAAIKHGVAIQLNFVLQLELPNGTGRIIGDADKVDIRVNLSFTAIAPDDNS